MLNQEASPDAVHFVLENLRRYWRDVPADLRKTSLVATMRNLIIVQQLSRGIGV
jgi:hypothetical protein